MLELIKTPTTVLHVIACLFLILVILIQPGRTGGLSGALGGAGATQIFGGRGAGNLLTKVSWTTATVFFLTSVTLAYLSSSKDESLQQRSQPAAEKPAEKLAAEKPAAPAGAGGAAAPAAPPPATPAPAASK
jgi:preprotein translocase subunit SecG